jgi:hypothetical protein
MSANVHCITSLTGCFELPVAKIECPLRSDFDLVRALDKPDL